MAQSGDNKLTYGSNKPNEHNEINKTTFSYTIIELLKGRTNIMRNLESSQRKMIHYIKGSNKMCDG